MLADIIGTARTIGEVVAAMRRIDGVLADGDGLKWFNLLYLRVTEVVQAEGAAWQDAEFLERFDVRFAQLYFEAVANWEGDRSLTPHAWRPLLRSRTDVSLLRLQFAFAGMNAHINHDLAVALENLAARDGRFPDQGGPRHRDFRHVNDILERVEASLHPVLAVGLVGDVDRKLGDLDSLLAMWKVRKAREAAWTNGEVLWQLRAAPLLKREFLDKLDRMTSFAGHGLLVPGLGSLEGA